MVEIFLDTFKLFSNVFKTTIFVLDVPGRVVGHDLVEVGDGDRVLGLLLVVADAGVLEPVAPQDLVRQVGGADLQHPVLHYVKLSTDLREVS